MSGNGALGDADLLDGEGGSLHARTRRGRDASAHDAKQVCDGYGAYAASKLANVLFTVEIARRLRTKPIRVNALHPGVVSTKLLREGFGMGGPDSLAEGAATSVHLALDDVKVSGRYFVAGREAQPSQLSRDAALCARFYEESCRRVGIEPIVG